jgi:hypothetical protein
MNAAEVLNQSQHNPCDVSALQVMALDNTLSHRKKIKAWLAAVGDNWQWVRGDEHLKRVYDFFNNSSDEDYEPYETDLKQLASLALLEIVRSSYHTTRREQLLDTDMLAVRPYWRLHLSDDVDAIVLCPHQKTKQLTHLFDHAFWDAAFPCQQLACNCSVFALAADELKN